MTRNIIPFLMILISGCCFGQSGKSIDTSALHILQKSWDRLAAMKDITYQMRMLDTMRRENQLNIQWHSIHGTIKKNAYSHFKINNKIEWLVRGDTLYKKDNPTVESITFTTDWDKHKVGFADIHNILGTERPSIKKITASLKFAQETTSGDFFVIEEIYKNTNDQSDEIQNELLLNRYFINKKSFLAFRRIKYAKRLENGKEAVDIYDFTAALDTNPESFEPATFFVTTPVKEINRLETLKIGTIAPPFSATDVKTGKTVNLDGLKGKVVILDFWHLSCSPCRELMPKLQKLHEKFSKNDVVIVGVNMRDMPKPIISFLNEKAISYAQYYKTGQLLAYDYKLQLFPTTLVLGKDGKVKLVETGVGEDTELKLERAIRKELATAAPKN